jgi:HPt (histidine-containing phosphotransfer) domain-containing protein
MAEAGDLQARLDAVRAAFIADLPNRAAALRAVWDEARAHGWQPASHDEFHRLVHSLSGAGATFGCSDLSERARALEIRLESPRPGDADTLPALFAELLTAIAAAADTHR